MRAVTKKSVGPPMRKVVVTERFVGEQRVAAEAQQRLGGAIGRGHAARCNVGRETVKCRTPHHARSVRHPHEVTCAPRATTPIPESPASPARHPLARTSPGWLLLPAAVALALKFWRCAGCSRRCSAELREADAE